MRSKNTLHICHTEDGIDVQCMCSTNKDHDEEGYDKPEE